MKNVLVIGNATSIWIKEYIRNVHCKLGNRVYLTNYFSMNQEDKLFYEQLNVEIINFKATNKVCKFAEYNYVLNKFIKRHKGQIDVVDIQSPPNSKQADIIKKTVDNLGAKSVVTFWGSDIMRIDSKGAKRMKKLLKQAKVINIGTEKMHEKFKSYYNEEFDDKCVYIGFGSPAITNIRDCKLSKEECKMHFGLDKNKIVVAIGYNGRREQQHLSAIKAFSKLDKELKDKIQILIHLGYGFDIDYKNEIKSLLEKSELNYVINEDMLDLEQVAILRIATDVFVHSQTTDGLSGSIREVVYAGAILLNPEWIKYDKFDKDGVEYVVYNDFNNLTEKMTDILKGKIKIDKIKNRKILYAEYSWESVEDRWASMLDA